MNAVQLAIGAGIALALIVVAVPAPEPPQATLQVVFPPKDQSRIVPPVIRRDVNTGWPRRYVRT